MITYSSSLAGVSVDQLAGFFAGWPSPPSSAQHLKILQNSSHRVLAKLEDNVVVGFVTAVSDGVLSAFIPLLEVRPEYQGQGIGTQLVQRLVAALGDPYMIDVTCDVSTASFYEKLGFLPMAGAAMRRPGSIP